MKRIAPISRLIGLLLLIFCLSLLPPMMVYAWYREGSIYPFLISFLFTLILGLALWLPTRNTRNELKARDGFLVVCLVWIVVCLLGAIPFYLCFFPTLSFTDALFESVSGLSTTGASVFTHLDQMPHSILYYRQQLTLLGGVGVVVIALSILPVLGVGGMQLYFAETGGPVKTSRLRPRLKETAKAIWLIYFVLVLACTLAYWLAGMSFFDAICQSFSSVATAGFSTHDSGLSYYHGHQLEIITVIFMILGSTNFGLHYHFCKKKSLRIYWDDPEFKLYLKIIFILWVVTAITVLVYGMYHKNIGQILVYSIFDTTSALSTTGYGNVDVLPTFVPFLLMLGCLIGGCGGSTSGGLKMLRFLILKRQGGREFKRLIHPQGVYSLYLGEDALPEKIIQGIWGFTAIYFAFLIFIVLALLSTGLDFRTAFGSAAGALSNTGLGLGQTASLFKGLNDASKWIITLAMFAGRLEIMTLLVLLTPQYWRK